MFPEGQADGLYHTSDATLWFFHAIDRYVEVTGDRETLQLILTTLLNIVYYHLRGTRFGIQVDPHDGLLRQGEEGYVNYMDGCQSGRLGCHASQGKLSKLMPCGTMHSVY